MTPHVESKFYEKLIDNENLANRLLLIINEEISRQKMMESLGLRDMKIFRVGYLNPSIINEWFEMTNPKARGKNQTYRLTRKGKIKQIKLKRI